MRYVYGAILWIFGGAVLAGAADVFAFWLGWVFLGGGVALFLPPLWQLEAETTGPAAAYLLRAPFLASGAVLVVLGVVLAGAMGSVVIDGVLAEAVMLGFASLLMFAAGGTLALPVLRNARQLDLARRPAELDVNVFQIAQAKGGRLTASELAADHGVSYAAARVALQQLVGQGACDCLVTRSGAVVYRFPELESDKRDLLEA